MIHYSDLCLKLELLNRNIVLPVEQSMIVNHTVLYESYMIVYTIEQFQYYEVCFSKLNFGKISKLELPKLGLTKF